MQKTNWKPILIAVSILLAGLTCTDAALAQSWSNGYAHRRVITIDHTKVPNTDQSNFPVLISGTYASLATTANGGNVTNASGYDIIFTSDSVGMSPLTYERDTYNSTTGTVDFWVLIPTLSHTSDTIIYMFYGNSSVTTDQSNRTAVWDANYLGVWHLKETSGQQNDSTSNGNNSTAVSVTAEGTAAGQIGGADQFTYSHPDHVDLPNIVLTSAFTLEAWIFPTTGVGYAHILTKEFTSNTAPWEDYALNLDASSPQKVSVGFDEAGTAVGITSNRTAPLNQWTHVVGTYDGSNLRLFLNGAADNSGPASGPVATISQTTEIGYNKNYSPQSFSGNIDEVRISSGARSADWIATEYANQSAPWFFYHLGAADAANVTNVSPTSGSAGTSVTITGTDFGATQGTSTVAFNGMVATPTSWSATQITVPVPSGATPGDVVVTISGAVSNGEFFMVPTPWSNGYSYRRTITIDHTRVPNTDQTNFPMAFSGTFPYLIPASNGGDVTNSNGYDLVFTSDAAGTNVLTFEQESYNSTTGAVAYWVKIPTISHTTDTVIYMFYGNSAITSDQSNKSAVWDSNYKSVWHLPNGTTLTVSDSTSNGNSGAIQGGVTAAAGEIGGGGNFNGTSGYISTINSFSWPFTMTTEAWVKTTVGGTKVSGLETSQTGTGSNGTDLNLYVNSNGRAVSGCYTGSYITVTSAVSVNGGNWHHLAATLNTSTNVMTLYVDGAPQGTANCSGVHSLTGYFRIGSWNLYNWPNASNGYFTGMIDEVRLSNSVRSADWIATEYNNQSNPATFYNLGSAYTGSTTVGPTVTSISPTSGLVGTAVTITGTDFGTTQGSSTVTLNGTPESPTSWTPTSIVAPVPASASTGFVVVTASGVSSNGLTFSVVPVITSVSATTGSIGAQVTILGSGFGAVQGTNQVTLNGASVTVNSWSATSIAVTIPAGATSGPLLVYGGPGDNSNSVYFTITSQPLPSPWLDGDVGTTGLVGSATYTNGTYTVKGAGTQIWGSSDSFHFAYQSLSGDGTIIARVVSATGEHYAGVMIRETLNSNSTNAFIGYELPSGYQVFQYRTTTGGATNYGSTSGSVPYWEKLVRSGNTFSGYISPDGINWTQVGTTQTITMATNVYIGLAVGSGSTSTLGTATFDNVSINSAAAPAPVISGIAPTTGVIGSPATINGSNFGATQGSSFVTLNTQLVTVNSWSSTSITITIPTGATSGPFVVTVAPSMNVSNPVNFTVTNYPLPPNWLDGDLGYTGRVGSATFSNGTYTVNGAGTQIWGSSDSFHFAYQSLSGDGTIIARVVSATGEHYAGVMIRETLNSNSTNAFIGYELPSGYQVFQYRTTTGGATNYGSTSGSVPYWEKLVRSGNTFSGYISPDGINWTQVGTTQTITMAANVYIGLAVGSGSTSTLGTATFDNVSINSAAAPAPMISGLSITSGAIWGQVTIAGSNFGATTQYGSYVTLNALPVTINSWSNTSITITIPTGATSGPFVVIVAPSMNVSNPFNFTVTNYPLPSIWLDGDIAYPGIVGNATYSNGTFTVQGAGGGIGGGSDSFHFVYQPLSGDGTIVARVVTATGEHYAGVMIRETLNANSTNAFMGYELPSSYQIFSYRSTTGGGSNYGSTSGSVPYWEKLVRSGNSFSGYISPDGINWTQVGSTQTIPMATNVYIGLAVSSGSTSTLSTVTIDGVSINSATVPAPVISTVSATTGTIGTQVTINGSHFGASQGSSLVYLSGLPMTVNSWSDTSVGITIASGAASGYLLVSVGPSMNESNPINFAITSQPLPSGWLDQDIGSVGVAGSAGYVSGTFTVKGAGGGIGGQSEAFHFAYQPLSGDGTIIARIASMSGANLAGVMIRETLNSNATYALMGYGLPSSYLTFQYRSTTGGTTNYSTASGALPYWMKLVRDGNTFTGYVSTNGTYWTQLGSTQTISMATNVYIGLPASSGNTTALGTAAYDNVSVNAASSPVITSISPTLGGPGNPITINGSDFGATQGSSSVYFNGAQATSITSWGNTQIVANVPSNASAGPLTVVANGNLSNQNLVFTFFNVTSLAPPAAPVGGTITLTGSGFGSLQGGSTVQVNGLNASATSWSGTSITAVVPNNATSGPVTITEGGVTSNTQQLTVIEADSVTGISPASGPAGTSVLITGTGFGPTQSNSAVDFYGAGAITITSWSDTAITAIVPAGAATGSVLVTVAGLTAQGPVFTVTDTTTLTDSLGNTTTYSSEVVGGQWEPTNSQGSGCSTCTVRGVVHNTYDSLGNKLTTTDSLGNVTTYTYDSSDNMLSESVQLNSTTAVKTSYTYNSFGEVLTVTDPLGNVTTNTYDSHGNLLTVTSPKPNSSTAASVTTFVYNTMGELTTITDPLSHVTTMTYTTAGLIATITDAQNNVTTYGYDAKGNRTSVTDALSHQTTFAYDAMNRLTTITYPDSTTSSFTYDIRGRRTSVTDQNGKTTSYAYDDADRLSSVTDAASHVTYYAYDTEDNLTSITDANSNQTAFTYDAFGRVTNTNFPSSLSETYQYDADNNLTQKTDRKNQTITYLYDALNRLTQKTYPDTTAVDYTYDLVGKILQVNDPTGTYAFAYDNMGRLIGTTTSYSFLSSRNFSNSYSYDAASNRTAFSDPESGSTSYSYDSLNRLSSLVPPSAFGSGSFGFSYDALSRRTQMTRPNSVTTNYSYDNLSRLTSVLHQLSGSTIDGASYTLDAAGNRTAKTDQLAAVTSNYTYDALYQLTQVTQANNTTESYSYDAVGNRTASLGVSSYTTNASNEMTANSNASYTYDSNGNTVTSTVGSNTTTYAWDYENRLTSVTLPGSGGTVSFRYDPYGRRIYKSSTSGTSIYAYNEDTIVEETNVAGAAVARYTQGMNIDEPLATLRSSTTSYYDVDGLGSVTSLSNSAGSLAQTYGYDSFGKQTSSSGSLTNPLQYTAREFDSETNLYYYRARYYDSGIGRFLSEDPNGFGGGIDFYSYVGNDPIGYLDPFGEIRYNKPPPATVPVTGQTLAALQCLEHCLQCITNNSNLNLLVTGGAELSGHKGHSFHYIGQAVDISFYNPVTTNQVFQCGESCGFTAGQAEPALHHWHLQLTPGNGVKQLPPMLPMKPCGPTPCQ